MGLAVSTGLMGKTKISQELQALDIKVKLVQSF